MTFQDEQPSFNHNPNPGAGARLLVDPQQLARLVMAARAAQPMSQRTSASAVNSPSSDVGTGPLISPQQLAQLVMAARAAQLSGNGGAAGQPSPTAAAAGSAGPGVVMGPLVDPQLLAQLTIAAGPSQRDGQLERTSLQAAQAPHAFVLGPTSPFAAGNGPQPSAPVPDPDPATAAAIQNVRQAQANPKKGAVAQSTSGSATAQARAKRSQIPLGSAPPPPGVPEEAYDHEKIKTLTVEQVAGVILGENGSGKYKVEPLPGRTTSEDLKKAKNAQAHAVINGDLRGGNHRPQTAQWQTTEAQRKTPEYQQALEAARTAYVEYKMGIDPTGGRVFFNNRFEKDVGKNEEDLRKDRIVRDQNDRPVGRERVFQPYGPFTVGGGKVWTLVYDEIQPIKSKKHVPPEKKGQSVPAHN